jgi:aryl-alcohol dehydrogenase-like predicted oxidoreductase
MPYRELSDTGIRVSAVAMGCWPITGISSLGVTVDQSEATIKAAFESGINFFDTAFSYGYAGESERMIGRTLGQHRDAIVIATKAGLHRVNGVNTPDGRPDTLRRECEESLRRLGTDRVEIFYLHAPDPNVPVAESAGAIAELIEDGKVLAAGMSNGSVEQHEQFQSACPLSASQPLYNMLQREIEQGLLPWCIARGISVNVYWPLLRGLLAGKLPRSHQFDARDGRARYPMFQGDEWEKNQDFIEDLLRVASEIGRPLVQLVVNWTLQQVGISTVLCGAKRPDQIRETAASMSWSLTSDELAAIDQCIANRGTPVSRAPAGLPVIMQ